MKNVFLATAASFTFASAAFAGTPGPIAPVIPVVVPAATNTGANWSGFYAGGLVSFDSGVQGYSNPPGTPPYIESNYNPNTSYGAFAGYNWQNGALVFGAEAAYNSGGFYTGGFTTEAADFVVDLKGRVGFAAGNALLYGVVGYSMTQWSTLATYSASGLSYGAGVDYMVGEHLFVGGEYLVRDMSGARSDNANQIGHAMVQSAQLRAGWKF